MTTHRIELSEHPFLLAKAIRIPHLKRRRKVWAFLPSDYFTNTEKRYPVIYFNDGQNIFESWKAAYGVSWEAHNSMEEMVATIGVPECILIGIEHGNSHRVSEYSPFTKEGGLAFEGNVYADFLANTLKNYVDKHLRTLPDRSNTYITGSSMGGLCALFTCFKHQDVFSKAGVMSPSLWKAPQIYALIEKYGQHYPTQFYLSVGTKEGESTIKNVKHLKQVLKAKGFTTVYNKVKGGEHNEALWQKEFKSFYTWLFS